MLEARLEELCGKAEELLRTKSKLQEEHNRGLALPLRIESETANLKRGRRFLLDIKKQDADWALEQDTAARQPGREIPPLRGAD